MVKLYCWHASKIAPAFRISLPRAVRTERQIGKLILSQRLPPTPENYPEEEWGVEDARIVYLPELEQHAVTYTAYSARGPLVSLALTRDFKTFERRGMIMEPEDKEAAFFPGASAENGPLSTGPSRPVQAQTSIFRFQLIYKTGATGRCYSNRGVATGGMRIRSVSALRPSRRVKAG